MNTLHILNEVYTNGYKTEVLDILAIIAILSGIFTIISRNPIISILFLIGLFGSISSYLIFLGSNFIGLSYLIVYIGAVSILFLFILMLINIRTSELHNDTRNSIPLAIFIIIFFNCSIFPLLPYDIAVLNNLKTTLNNKLYFIWSGKYSNESNLYKITDNNLSYTISNDWDTNLIETNNISSIGNVIYTSHNIWLIITSFILLLAMVGAIIITIKQER